jgi:hypothetical protein
MPKVVEMKPRAPAIALKLEAAREVLRELEQDVGQFALEAAEGAPGASKRLGDLRTTIANAQRDATELEKAHAVAARIDRQTAVTAAVQMRSEQLAEFKEQFGLREKAMGAVLKAASEMASAYGEYSEATLRAATATPSGTVVPIMAIGANGSYGAVFGPCERLILTEIFRCAPDRLDGIGRFVLPFAKAPNELDRGNPEAIRPGIDEMRDAHVAIIADIESQIEKLNEQAMAGAAAVRKDAA